MPTSFPQLTRLEMNPRGGCQCKLAGLALEDLLAGAYEQASGDGGALWTQNYPEDCAVVEIAQTRLLLSTDLTPLVGTDLFAAGCIAALHAMSDIFAVGGIPKWALVNMVVSAEQPVEQSTAVLAGIVRQCATEGTKVVGGQTIVGSEAMAGLCVLGIPRSPRLLKKQGAQPGDLLMLSKPLGVGLILRGYKLGILDDMALSKAVSTMTTSNVAASVAALAADVSASTDVTGFGLLGHLSEMLGPDLGAILELRKVPVLKEALSVPGEVARTIWIQNNYDYVKSRVHIRGISNLDQLSILLDPQTNGGLLVSSRAENADRLRSEGFVEIGRIAGAAGVEISE
jgi:selenide, water dikinase